jgi:16S rRNA (uracil1498-N3)-methyltransferase
MRVLVERGSWEAGKRVSLDGHERHHLQVRRARDGEKVELLDGAGLHGSGTLVKAGEEWLVEINTAEVQRPPAVLTLAVASGDRDRFSRVVEKSAELGVTRIVPLETRHTAGVATRLKDAHIARLGRSALEATKQCGASWAPVIEHPVPLESFVREPLSGHGWLAHQSGAPAPASMDQRPVTVIVGPEGGLTDDEVAMTVGAGYQPVALGSYTLRFETAALAAAAAVTQARMRGQYG